MNDDDDGENIQIEMMQVVVNDWEWYFFHGIFVFLKYTFTNFRSYRLCIGHRPCKWL